MSIFLNVWLLCFHNYLWKSGFVCLFGIMFITICKTAASCLFACFLFSFQSHMSRERGRRYCPSCTNDTAPEKALVQTLTSLPATHVSAMPTTGTYWSTTAQKRTWVSSVTMRKNFTIPMQSPHRTKCPLARWPMGVTIVLEYDLIMSSWPCVQIVWLQTFTMPVKWVGSKVSGFCNPSKKVRK